MLNFFRLSLLGVVAFAAGCGGTITGTGAESNPDQDPGRSPASSSSSSPPSPPSSVTLTSSEGPIFDCPFDFGDWPSTTSRLVVTRTGANLVVDGEVIPFQRIDKSGPHSSYVTYLLRTANVDVSISGQVGPSLARPMSLVRYRKDGTATSFHCKERRSSTMTGIFADRALDELVTATGGSR